MVLAWLSGGELVLALAVVLLLFGRRLSGAARDIARLILRWRTGIRL